MAKKIFRRRLSDKFKYAKEHGDVQIIKDMTSPVENLKSMNDPIFFIDKNNKFLDCNSATLKLFNFNCCYNFLGVHPGDISPEYQPDGKKSKDKANEMMKIAYEKGSHNFKWVHKKADGTEFPCTILLLKVQFNNGKNVGLYARLIDISKDVDNVLKLNKIVEQSPHGLLMLDENGKILKMNDKFIEFFDTTPDLKLKDINNFKYFKLQTFVNDLLTGKINNKDIFKVKHIQSNKSFKWFNIRGFNTLDDKGNRINTVVLFSDITKQIKTKNTMKNTKKELDNYYNILPEGMYELDKNLNLIKVNKSFCKLFETEEDDILGKNICDLFTDKNAVNKCLNKYKYRVKTKDAKTYNQKFFTNTSDGKEKLIEIVSILKWDNHCLEDNNCVGSYGIAIDISSEIEEHKKKIEELKNLKRSVDKNLKLLNLSKNLAENELC